jgi:opacity protein-like surface antigen
MLTLKLHMVSLSLLALCLTLAAVPAMAQVLYSNGNTNGTYDALTINFGYTVSDTFPIAPGGATVTGADFAMWLFEGDTLETAELSITSGENGGTSYFNQVLNFTQSACSLNQYGYDICTESASFSGPTLNSGTYWLNLQNAVTAEGEPVYWDEDSGPSSASQTEVGTIPSESFTVLGTSSSSTTSTTSTTGTSVPEPSSIMLFGSGILGLANVVRRKLI